ncbi:MAG: ACT domain-containing protein [Ruminococcaceae bacterium]|nr:ACT domain-containing protein [Oscillospiraceae bacterium]
MKSRAVISVTGKDNVGIIAKVSTLCAKYGANIIDISQTVLNEYFAMIMIVEIDGLTIPFTEFSDVVSAYGKENSLEIYTMHEDIFDSMHKI